MADNESTLIFFVNGRKISVQNPCPTTLLVHYLRSTLKLTGSKLACGEGACGSCTVLVSKFERHTSTISHYSVNACITPLCSLHGLAVTTVEAIGSTKTQLNPIQKRLSETHGIQCGYCSPGMVMSMYALLKNNQKPTELQIEDALKGNLCRCTGYRPILDSFRPFAAGFKCPMGDECCQVAGQKSQPHQPVDSAELVRATLDSTQELIFPSELQLNDKLDKEKLTFRSSSATWYRPATLQQLLELKHSHPDAIIVAGATFTAFQIKKATVHAPVTVISTHGVPELSAIQKTDTGVQFGAMTTISAMEKFLTGVQVSGEKKQLISAMAEMFHRFGSSQIRNSATLGGGLALADCQSDINVLLLASDCTISIASFSGKKRDVKVQEFFDKGKQAGLQKNEIIVSVFVPHSIEWEYYEFIKEAPRRDMCLAEFSAAVRVKFEPKSDVVLNATLVFGGDWNAQYLTVNSCKTLLKRHWSEETLDAWFAETTKEVKGFLGKDHDVHILPLIQGVLLKFFLKVYRKITNHMDLKELSETQNVYLNALKETTHSGVQVFDANGGQVQAAETDSVGKSLRHAWAPQCSTGEAVYVDDMRPAEGELYLGVVLSTVANGKIVSIDASKALAMPGVIDFLDHRSVAPGRNVVGEHGGSEEIFAATHVRWVGQVIGAILAESHQQARAAAQAVTVVYEKLPPIITIEDAIANNSFHPAPVFMPGLAQISYGDATEAMKHVDHVIEGEVKVGGQEHFYMEPYSVRVVPLSEDGQMEVFAGTQCPNALQTVLCKALNVMANKITIRTKRMGGSFGGKESRVRLISLPCALAAQKHGRPVRCMLDRMDDMQMTGNRRPYLAKYKIGFNKNGKLEALVIDMYGNDGYLPEASLIFMGVSICYINNVYSIPNMIGRGYSCKTNLPPCTPMRGAGAPQGVFICEYWLSQVASYLNIPIHKIQEINLYKGGEMSYVNVPIEESLRTCFFDTLKQSNYEQLRREIDEFNSKNKHVKRGLSILPSRLSIGFPPMMYKAGALVNIYTDGSVLISHGGTESGQGLHTKLIQIASRALDVSYEFVHISETCTSIVPNAVVTAGSAGTDLFGMAVLKACEILRERLDKYRKAAPDKTWKDWVAAAEFDRVCMSAFGFFNDNSHENFDWVNRKGRKYQYFTYGAAAGVVEVDCLTGSCTIQNVEIVMDVGKSINPAIDVGQIEGAFIMGVGYHALENHEFNSEGHLVTKGAGKYHLPTVSSIPAKMNVTLLKDCANEAAVYSSKAIGEPPLLLSGVIFFAIRDAVLSARKDKGLPTKGFQFNSPATTQTIRAACVK